MQREVLVDRHSTQFKRNNQSDNNIAPNKDKYFQQIAAIDEIVSQPDSFIKRPQADTIMNTSGREKQLTEVKSSDSSTSAERKSIVILGDSMIKHVNGY